MHHPRTSIRLSASMPSRRLRIARFLLMVGRMMRGGKLDESVVWCEQPQIHMLSATIGGCDPRAPTLTSSAYRNSWPSLSQCTHLIFNALLGHATRLKPKELAAGDMPRGNPTSRCSSAGSPRHLPRSWILPYVKHWPLAERRILIYDVPGPWPIATDIAVLQQSCQPVRATAYAYQSAASG